MKVYILTFHGSVNYGAVLQAYALSKTITNLGFDCKIIDYNRELHHKNFLKIESGSLKGKIYQLLNYRDKSILHKKFNRFIKSNMPLTDYSYNGFNSLNSFSINNEDVIIVGSDQIWNCELTENNLHYFLDFTDSKKKFSYAASFGVSDISTWNNKNTVVDLLKRFSKISVREESGKDIINNELNVNSEVVCDPTFLLSSNDWNMIATDNKKEKYILLFMLTYNDDLVAKANELSVKTGLPIINIAYTVKSVLGAVNVKNLSPDEWLGYIKNADFIFTNSFHGFALSLNYNKQVWVALTKGSRNSRILDLAKRYGVTNRIINTDTFDCSKINYSVVSEKMVKDKNKSIGFLEEILNGK